MGVVATGRCPGEDSRPPLGLLTKLKRVLTGGPLSAFLPGEEGDPTPLLPRRGRLRPNVVRSISSSASARLRSALGTGIFCASFSGVFIFSRVSRIALAVEEIGAALEELFKDALAMVSELIEGSLTEVWRADALAGGDVVVLTLGLRRDRLGLERV